MAAASQKESVFVVMHPTLSPETRSRLRQAYGGPARPAPELVRASTPQHVIVEPLLGGHVVDNPGGQHLCIEQSLAALWPAGMPLVNRCVAAWRDRSVSIEPPHPELAAFRDCFPQDVLFLDLETSGFAGSTIFLAGLVHATDSGLSLSQLWARDYTEEPAVLHTLWQIATTASVLVTFNGKSFDWPQVRDRSILHRVGGAWDRDAQVLVHCDLLHHARRLWKHQLPDCRLQTLERLICRRRRTGDIAGRDIPQVYHDYVRRGDTTLVRSILHHNAVDLVTLVQLSLHVVCVPGMLAPCQTKRT